MLGALKRRSVVAAVVVAAPWTWFAVRNLGFVFDLLAIGLPVLLVLAALGLAVFVAVRRGHAELVAGSVSCLVTEVTTIGSR